MKRTFSLAIAAAVVPSLLAACAGGVSQLTPTSVAFPSAVTQTAAKQGNVKMTEYQLAAGTGPVFISEGPGNAMWFGEPGTYPSYTFNAIGRISTSNAKIQSFVIPTAQCGLSAVIEGYDGAIWFTEYQTAKIGRMTPSGVLTNEYATPKMNPVNLVKGPDGALWFTDQQKHGKIGRITMHGSVAAFPVAGLPAELTVGSDGALWFTDLNNHIGRITTGGSVREYPIPSKKSVPLGIVAGPDGNVWFAESASNKIGRITSAGTITEYTVPTPKSGPNSLAVGPDAAIWFSENTANKIARVTTDGAFTEYPIASKNSEPYGLSAGPGKTIWFTEYATNKIGRIQLP